MASFCPTADVANSRFDNDLSEDLIRGSPLWIRRVLVELRALRALAPLARLCRAPAASGRTRRAQEGQSQNGAGSLRHSGLFRGCFSRPGLAASFADRTASPVRASDPGPRLGLSSALPECLPLANRRIKRPQARYSRLTAPRWALARA